MTQPYDFGINNAIRSQFPTLVNNPDLVYFDSAASTQTQQTVINTMNHYYTHTRCNVGRGDFPMSSIVTQEIEEARASVARLVGAKPHQIAFTSGTTESLNWIAQWHKDVDKVAISSIEHSANILPWLAQGRRLGHGLQLLSEDYIIKNIGATEPIMAELICVTAADNMLGDDSIFFYALEKKMDHNILAVDLAQVVGHRGVDLTNDWPEIDYAAFSAHKMFGPVGIGAIYSKKGFDHLEPVKYGGGQALDYDYSTVTYAAGPAKHEPGTPNIAGILGFGVAAEWIMFNTIEVIQAANFAVYDSLLSSEFMYDPRIEFADAFQSAPTIISFKCLGFHPSDLSAYLGEKNIAVRVGKICSHPQVNKFSYNGIVRISTGPYNNYEDVQKLDEAICQAIKKLT